MIISKKKNRGNRPIGKIVTKKRRILRGGAASTPPDKSSNNILAKRAAQLKSKRRWWGKKRSANSAVAAARKEITKQTNLDEMRKKVSQITGKTGQSNKETKKLARQIESTIEKQTELSTKKSFMTTFTEQLVAKGIKCYYNFRDDSQPRDLQDHPLEIKKSRLLTFYYIFLTGYNNTFWETIYGKNGLTEPYNTIVTRRVLSSHENRSKQQAEISSKNKIFGHLFFDNSNPPEMYEKLFDVRYEPGMNNYQALLYFILSLRQGFNSGNTSIEHFKNDFTKNMGERDAGFVFCLNRILRDKKSEHSVNDFKRNDKDVNSKMKTIFGNTNNGVEVKDLDISISKDNIEKWKNNKLTQEEKCRFNSKVINWAFIGDGGNEPAFKGFNIGVSNYFQVKRRGRLNPYSNLLFQPKLLRHLVKSPKKGAEVGSMNLDDPLKNIFYLRFAIDKHREQSDHEFLYQRMYDRAAADSEKNRDEFHNYLRLFPYVYKILYPEAPLFEKQEKFLKTMRGFDENLLENEMKLKPEFSKDLKQTFEGLSNPVYLKKGVKLDPFVFPSKNNYRFVVSSSSSDDITLTTRHQFEIPPIFFTESEGFRCYSDKDCEREMGKFDPMYKQSAAYRSRYKCNPYFHKEYEQISARKLFSGNNSKKHHPLDWSRNKAEKAGTYINPFSSKCTKKNCICIPSYVTQTIQSRKEEMSILPSSHWVFKLNKDNLRYYNAANPDEIKFVKLHLDKFDTLKPENEQIQPGTKLVGNENEAESLRILPKIHKFADIYFKNVLFYNKDKPYDELVDPNKMKLLHDLVNDVVNDNNTFCNNFPTEVEIVNSQVIEVDTSATPTVASTVASIGANTGRRENRGVGSQTSIGTGTGTQTQPQPQPQLPYGYPPYGYPPYGDIRFDQYCNDCLTKCQGPLQRYPMQYGQQGYLPPPTTIPAAAGPPSTTTATSVSQKDIILKLTILMNELKEKKEASTQKPNNKKLKEEIAELRKQLAALKEQLARLGETPPPPPPPPPASAPPAPESGVLPLVLSEAVDPQATTAPPPRPPPPPPAVATPQPPEAGPRSESGVRPLVLKSPVQSRLNVNLRPVSATLIESSNNQQLATLVGSPHVQPQVFEQVELSSNNNVAQHMKCNPRELLAEILKNTSKYNLTDDTKDSYENLLTGNGVVTVPGLDTKIKKLVKSSENTGPPTKRLCTITGNKYFYKNNPKEKLLDKVRDSLNNYSHDSFDFLKKQKDYSMGTENSLKYDNTKLVSYFKGENVNDKNIKELIEDLINCINDNEKCAKEKYSSIK